MILLRLFKNSRTAGVAAIIIISPAIFIHSFIHKVEIVAYSAMPFYNLIFGMIHTTPVLNRIITLLLLLIICYMLIRINFRYVLLEFRSFMPAFFFLLFAVALPATQQVSPALVGSLFYLLCFGILFDVPDKPPDTFSVFIAGIVLAVGSMFYLKLIWFLPLIWISLGTMRSVTWRELLFPVIAYLLLGLFLFTWYWALQDHAAGFTMLIKENLSFQETFALHHFSAYLYYGYFLLMVLVASIYMVNRFQSRKRVIQNIYQVMFFMFLAGILFFLFIAQFDTTSLIYIALPISFILANNFHRRKNHLLHELALWVLIGLLVFVQVSITY